jgi:hypothetical protein
MFKLRLMGMKMRADVLAGVNQRLAATTKQKEKGEGERHAKGKDPNSKILDSFD